MNKRLLILTAIFALAFAAAGCAGIDGVPEGIPSIEASFTEVGNPDENEAQLKGVYVNNEFDVLISYPLRFSVDAKSPYQILFSSANGEEMMYSFMWLEDGDSFISFIEDVRGASEDLERVSAPQFDRALCKVDSDTTRDGIRTVECYYYRETDRGSFVMAVTGQIKDESEFETLREIPSDTDKRRDSSRDEGLPTFTINPDLISDDDSDELPTVGIVVDSIKDFSAKRPSPAKLKIAPFTPDETRSARSSE